MTWFGAASDSPCPCGTGLDYGACCRPLHLQERQAATAAELMRSRYSAFVVGDDDHLFRTWHPRTRPDDVDGGGARWLGLEVLSTVDGGPDDAAGVVEFRARHDGGVLHERSRFARRAGRWFYVDGEVAEE